jgi:hypothetical protein
MKYLNLFLTSILLCLSFPIISRGQDTHVEEQLTMYGYSTEIGTIGKRLFCDRSGHVYKEIYYTSKDPAALPPYSEDGLKEQIIVLNTYNEKGYKIRAERFDANMKLKQLWTAEYHKDIESLLTHYTPEGVRQSEQRYVNNRSVCTLSFDEKGKKVIGISGAIPQDIDLAFDWGDSNNGLACGIGIVYAQSLYNRTYGYKITVNIKNSASTFFIFPGLPGAEIEIRDSSGRKIKEKAEYRHKKQDPLHRSRLSDGGVIMPGEAMHINADCELNTRYESFAPGRYSIRIKQPIKGKGQSLVSNTVFFEVEGQKK